MHSYGYLTPYWDNGRYSSNKFPAFQDHYDRSRPLSACPALRPTPSHCLLGQYLSFRFPHLHILAPAWEEYYRFYALPSRDTPPSSVSLLRQLPFKVS